MTDTQQDDPNDPETAPRSNWSRFPDDVGIGDRIRVSLEVKEMPDDEREACDFCSTIESHQPNIAERGLIEADYRLVNTYGVTFGYTCHACISDSRVVEETEIVEK